MADDVLIKAAKRNMDGIVPLYYSGLKGPAKELNSDNIYESMIWAYTSCNIGYVSNSISKVWCSSHGIDVDLVKSLVKFNNLVIDGAKNLYLPPLPDDVNGRLRQYSRDKVPYFFIEAKQKTKKQVAPINDATVNRIRGLLPNVRLNFNWDSCGKLDWRMLCSSTIIPSNDITNKIIQTYTSISSKMKFKMDDDTDGTNKHFLCSRLREELLYIHPDPDFVCDVLVKYLFCTKNSRRKMVFWECFGREVVEHLENNIDRNQVQCVSCGKRFFKDAPNQFRCPHCAKKHLKAYNAKKQKEYYDQKKNSVYSGNSLKYLQTEREIGI